MGRAYEASPAAPTPKGGEPMTDLLVIAYHTIAPGQESEVLAALPTFIEAARTEPGNIAIAAYRQLDDDRAYVLLERYTSREAYAAHRQTAHYTDLILGQIVPRLERRAIELHDVAGEGPH